MNGHTNCISLGDTFYILWCVFFTMNFYLFLRLLFLSFFCVLSFIFLLYLCEAKCPHPGSWNGTIALSLGSSGNWETLELLACCVTCFLELPCHLPLFYFVAVFSFDRWVLSVLANILPFAPLRMTKLLTILSFHQSSWTLLLWLSHCAQKPAVHSWPLSNAYLCLPLNPAPTST